MAYGPTSHMNLNPSPAHSLHRVGDATQGWDPVADALFRLLLFRTRNDSPVPVGIACLAIPSALQGERGAETSPS
jgi:hypothetical protein